MNALPVFNIVMLVADAGLIAWAVYSNQWAFAAGWFCTSLFIRIERLGVK